MNQRIMESLETLAAACPWDSVSLEVKRAPAGDLRFVAIVTENEKLGFPFDCAWGETPEQTVNDLIRKQACRDPEKARDAKLAKLREQIQKLEAVVIGLPPYIPNRELAAQAESLKAQTVDVESAVSA